MPEVQANILDEAIGCKDYHSRTLEFGERARIAKGKKVDVVYWDTGNGWCAIMQVIPKGNKECLERGIEFYKELEKVIKMHPDEEF